ncbi:hypothetical protein R50912_32015 [Paenibacillus sp. FSL R5-0912]|nr:hypothetical protein R50912_32015 [Paenibacillus sp. FSL R5-0912]
MFKGFIRIILVFLYENPPERPAIKESKLQNVQHLCLQSFLRVFLPATNQAYGIDVFLQSHTAAER